MQGMGQRIVPSEIESPTNGEFEIPEMECSRAYEVAIMDHCSFPRHREPLVGILPGTIERIGAAIMKCPMYLAAEDEMMGMFGIDSPAKSGIDLTVAADVSESLSMHEACLRKG